MQPRLGVGFEQPIGVVGRGCRLGHELAKPLQIGPVFVGIRHWFRLCEVGPIVGLFMDHLAITRP
jgi:hypothetical protein